MNKENITNIISFPKFSVGQLVHHKNFSYRGVIIGVDATFKGSEEWYQQMAVTKPPKDKPWYHVLVHDAEHTTYVTERNLEQDTELSEINHPMISELFSGFEDGRYIRVLN